LYLHLTNDAKSGPVIGIGASLAPRVRGSVKAAFEARPARRWRCYTFMLLPRRRTTQRHRRHTHRAVDVSLTKFWRPCPVAPTYATLYQTWPTSSRPAPFRPAGVLTVRALVGHPSPISDNCAGRGYSAPLPFRLTGKPSPLPFSGPDVPEIGLNARTRQHAAERQQPAKWTTEDNATQFSKLIRWRGSGLVRRRFA